ncbi:DsrE family protein [Tepidicaulis sp. LMO-SS28]|uniref:DsrE family protein n=1 Tax=Tepidicaulis sp. LMO-SS28 TaxID=3447455 RepID=UPI003EE2272C
MTKKTAIAFAIMDPPYESGRSTSFFRMLSIAAGRGYDIKVFAYEGGVHLAFDKQAPHGNAVHGHDVEEENHPLPKVWIAELMKTAEENGGSLDWVNCGLCADERGVNESICGARRGSPADFWNLALEAGNALTIGTR